jgi:hypothetical protein
MVQEDPAVDDFDIGTALARKGIATACLRCHNDDWSRLSGSAFLPDMGADQVSVAGGTAAAIRACNHCGCIELYNPGLLAR